MSGTSSSGTNGTVILSGPAVIQLSDVYVKAGILHPITVGSASILVLFIYLRLGSNRSIAPITVFDWVINVALGSTLAGIVNGNSLTRGLLALATMLAFQYITSTLATRFHERLAWAFQGPPLVIAFRGEMLMDVMLKHRISPNDIYAALRQKGVLNVCQVEVGIIEPTGNFSIFTKRELMDANVEPDVLMVVPAYKMLCENAEKRGGEGEGGKENGGAEVDVEKGEKSKERNVIAGGAA